MRRNWCAGSSELYWSWIKHQSSSLARNNARTSISVYIALVCPFPKFWHALPLARASGEMINARAPFPPTILGIHGKIGISSFFRSHLDAPHTDKLSGPYPTHVFPFHGPNVDFPLKGFLSYCRVSWRLIIFGHSRDIRARDQKCRYSPNFVPSPIFELRLQSHAFPGFVWKFMAVNGENGIGWICGSVASFFINLRNFHKFFNMKRIDFIINILSFKNVWLIFRNFTLANLWKIGGSALEVEKIIQFVLNKQKHFWAHNFCVSFSNRCNEVINIWRREINFNFSNKEYIFSTWRYFSQQNNEHISITEFSIRSSEILF